MKILVCPPDYYNIEYEINAWMNLKQGAQRDLAAQQWQNLIGTIKQCGAEVVEVAAASGLPDMVFTANAALINDNKVYLSRFKCPERQPEYTHFRTWFEQNTDYTLADEPEDFFDADGNYIGPAFEGAGDALFVGDCLFAGTGFRSDIEIYPIINRTLNIKQHVICELVDPHYYHLDTCFCPINDKQAIWFPDAFSPASQKLMQQHAELFEIPAAEAKHFACNAVVIDKNVITPTECPETKKILNDLGYTVHQCEVTEYIKAGGACKCLTLRLD